LANDHGNSAYKAYSIQSLSVITKASSQNVIPAFQRNYLFTPQRNEKAINME